MAESIEQPPESIELSLELKMILLIVMKRIASYEIRLLVPDKGRFLEVAKEFDGLARRLEQDVTEAQNREGQ